MPNKGRSEAQEYELNTIYETEETSETAFRFNSLIFIMAIAVIIVMITALVFLYIYSNPESEAGRFNDNNGYNAVPPPRGAIVADPALNATGDNGNNGYDGYDEDESGYFGVFSEVYDYDANSDTNDTRDALPADVPANYTVVNYDIATFLNTLFIGDSIFTGIDGYDFLPPENVFAQVGIMASEAENIEINGRKLFGSNGIVKDFKSAVIMLGTNGLDGTNSAQIASDVYSMAVDIRIAHPAISVVVLTLPPVEAENEYGLTNDLINGFNSALKAFFGEQRGGGIDLVDFNAALRDTNDFLDSRYAQPDGVHLNRAGYEMMFSMLQNY
ncbi:MAG: GDSL-type esterase/lipase family protein [Oscillospiraceae bacterium]|nr:GDSL-type esterase/lipase family protein [Oscillospiraceae bacterium]